MADHPVDAPVGDDPHDRRTDEACWDNGAAIGAGYNSRTLPSNEGSDALRWRCRDQPLLRCRLAGLTRASGCKAWSAARHVVRSLWAWRWPMSDSHSGPGLRDRRTERAALDPLLAGARAGQSRVLVLRGEAGVGKTALLDYLQAQASGFRVARAVGVEPEMEFAFAGLHQLCTPMLSNFAGLPGPPAAPPGAGVTRTAQRLRASPGTASSDRGSALGTSTDASALQREGRCVVTHPERSPHDQAHAGAWRHKRSPTPPRSPRPRSGRR